MKRIDAEGLPVLKLLAKGATLNDLIAYEPEDEPFHGMSMDEIRSFAQTQSFAEREFFYKKIKEGEKRLLAVASPNRIGCALNSSKVLDKMEEMFPQTQEGIDRIFTTPKPKAYFLPDATIKLISENPMLFIGKLADIMPDLPHETCIVIFDRPELDIQWYAWCDIAPNYFTGINLGSIPTKNTMLHDCFWWNLSYNDKGVAPIWCGRSDEIEGSQTLVAFALIALLFIHFFEAEKHTISQPVANDKRYNTVTVAGEKYGSNLTYPVEIIDTSWFTTIIHDDPFLVRGHFRRQPYGQGRAQYKMKWIKSFMKQGYTRRSRHTLETHP